MELDSLLMSIRLLREQRHDTFRLNSLVQIGTADARFQDPVAYAADPTGNDGDLPLRELAQRLGVSERLVAEVRLVSDGPWDCALRTRLLEACGLVGVDSARI
jgi:hypothetical protein